MFKTFSTMLLLSAMAVSKGHAQTNQPLHASIPFAFTVKDTTLAAGDYRLSYSTTSHVLSILDLDGTGSVAVLALASSPADAGPGRLVFTCYDKDCYLHQVWQGAGTGAGKLQVVTHSHGRSIEALKQAAYVSVPLR